VRVTRFTGSNAAAPWVDGIVDGIEVGLSYNGGSLRSTSEIAALRAESVNDGRPCKIYRLEIRLQGNFRLAEETIPGQG